MKNICLALFALLALAVAPASFAQATRTWVSGVGDDANPCSRTAPCKTFAGAISKTAAGGEIDALDPGGFGTVTITKAITIDGGGGIVASILASGTNGIVINAAATDAVTLRNLSISGAGGGLNGVRFLNGKTLVIDNCKIFQFTQNGVDVELAQATRAHVAIRNSSITNNVLDGVHLQNTGGATPVLDGIVTGTEIRGGTGGANPSNGVVAAQGAIVDVVNSDIGSYTGSGLLSSGTGGAGLTTVINASDTTITDGGTGATSTGTGVVRLSNVNVFNQTTAVTSGAFGTAGNNHSAGIAGSTSTTISTF